MSLLADIVQIAIALSLGVAFSVVLVGLGFSAWEAVRPKGPRTDELIARDRLGYTRSETRAWLDRR